MGMNRHDAYYEPFDYDDRSDEIEELTYQMMKPGAEYDPNTVAKVVEALTNCDEKTAKALQDCIDSKDYEQIGRKIMMIAFEYMEVYAKESAEFEINEG